MAIDKSKMKCNSPRRQISGGKKFVVKACKGGKEKIIRYGDANMTIKNLTLQDERALEQGTDVLLLKMCSVLDTGHVKNGNKRRKLCQWEKELMDLKEKKRKIRKKEKQKNNN